jgi:hypothetical protein
VQGVAAGGRALAFESRHQACCARLSKRHRRRGQRNDHDRDERKERNRHIDGDVAGAWEVVGRQDNDGPREPVGDAEPQRAASRGHDNYFHEPQTPDGGTGRSEGEPDRVLVLAPRNTRQHQA